MSTTSPAAGTPASTALTPGVAAARLLRTTTTALAYVDTGLQVRFANATFGRWFNAGLASPPGQRLDELVGSATWLALRAPVQQALRGESGQCEGKFGGRAAPRYLRGQCEPDRDRDGRLIGLVLAFTDLSRRHALEIQLRSGEQRYAQAFQHVPAGMALVHPGGQLLRANRALASLLGATVTELAARNWNDLLTADDAATSTALAADLAAGRSEQATAPLRLRHRDGHPVPVLLHMAQVSNDAGAQHCLVMLVEDASRHERFAQAIARESALAGAAIEALGDAVILTDPGLHVLALNPVAEALTGWRNVDARGHLLHEVFAAAGDTRAEDTSPAQRALDHDTPMSLPEPFALRHRLGFTTPVTGSIAPMHDAAGTVIGAALGCRDASEHRELTLRLIRLARRDGMTGLPTRRALPTPADRAVRLAALNGWRCALLHVGLDGFRHVNQTCGRAAGDAALRALAGSLRATLHDGDSLYRGDGDEFLLLMPRVDAAGAATAQAARIAARCAALVPEGAGVPLRASIGVSVYPDDADDVDSLLANAAGALGTAKAAGGGVTRHAGAAPAPRTTAPRDIAEGLRAALATGAMALHYQPRVDAASGRVVGAEALLRWQAHGRDVYVPHQFIPVAEDSGLIVELGAWVLRAACAQARAWRALGRLTPISVNISARQLRHERFCAELDALMAEYAIGRGELELELGEGSLLAGGAATTQLLERIRQRGVHLALDDFGSGYGSVACLADTPAEVLKIDRRLVRDVATDREAGATASAMIALARQHRKLVIAKGVETPDQAEFLRTAACSQLQGFYCGAPMPAAQLEPRLRAA